MAFVKHSCNIDDKILSNLSFAGNHSDKTNTKYCKKLKDEKKRSKDTLGSTKTHDMNEKDTDYSSSINNLSDDLEGTIPFAFSRSCDYHLQVKILFQHLNHLFFLSDIILKFDMLNRIRTKLMQHHFEAGKYPYSSVCISSNEHIAILDSIVLVPLKFHTCDTNFFLLWKSSLIKESLRFF